MGEQQDEHQIVERYKAMLNERDAIAGMVLERQSDVDEHALVLKTLKNCKRDRKAWRLVGDVLVERTVETVIPEVEKNKEKLSGVVENAKQQLENKAKEMREFEKRYNIRIKERNDGGKSTSRDDSKAQQGVLVK
jgi:prefoldin subunit 2